MREAPDFKIHREGSRDGTAVESFALHVTNLFLIPDTTGSPPPLGAPPREQEHHWIGPGSPLTSHYLAWVFE